MADRGSRSRLRRWAPVVLLLAVFLSLGTAEAQDKSLYWQRYDVDLTIQTDGDYRVVETQELVFTNGTFRYGQREIDLNRLGGISDITVEEEGGPQYVLSSSGDPYTYSVTQEGNAVEIRYNFPPTSDGRRTIVIGYTVSDALRYYPNVTQLFWKAIPPGNPFPTQSSVITLHLPDGATFTNYGVYGAEATADFQAGQTDATITLKGPIPAYNEVEVVAEWPAGIVQGTPQPWQQTLDAQAAVKVREQEFRSRWGPVFDLGFGSLAALIAVGGLVLLYLWWYNKGRDVPVGLIADYLPEPPSDLPPSVVGTLVDESADMQDIVAGIVDLARRGVLEIEEQQEAGFLGIGSSADFVYRLKKKPANLRPYEKELLDELFDDGKEVKLSDLRNEFYSAIPKLRKLLYEEVVSEGFFTASPEKTRTAFSAVGVGVLVLTVCLGLFLVGLLVQYSSVAFCLPFSAGIVAIGAIILARYMPRRTRKGADANARWLAFKRYLQDIEKYTKVEEATAAFDRYLPYAIAFGLEQSWIAKFSRAEAPVPTWWIPFPGPAYGPSGHGGSPGHVPGHAAPRPFESGSSRPSLEGMSRGMGTSLASMSAGLGTMLSTAGSTLSSRPSSSGGGGFSGGGFSGGGGSSGGGSGGGGSSFG